MILRLINKLTKWHTLKDFVPKSFLPLDVKVQETLKDQPNGVYLIHFKASDSLFGKLIVKFTKGNFSHTAIMLKCKNFLTYMSDENMAKVRNSLDTYYASSIDPFDKD